MEIDEESQAQRVVVAPRSPMSNSGIVSTSSPKIIHSPKPAKPGQDSSLPFSSPQSLLQPSSFSSALASHPFMQRSPNGMVPAAAASSSLMSGDVPMFSLKDSTNSSSSGKPITPAHIGSYASSNTSISSRKRTSDQFDMTHATDQTPLEQPTQKIAKHKLIDSDDEETTETPAPGFSPSQDQMEDDNLVPSNSSRDGKVQIASNDEDSSFMSLLSKLANLEFPNRNELCPLCPNSFPLDKFAEHVYECIKKLDDEERKAQELLDAKYATELAFGEREESFGGGRGSGRFGVPASRGGATTPEQLERDMLKKFESKRQEHCKWGSQCNRTDAHHFINKYHPEVECPICSVKFPVYEVDAHITVCLDTPKQATPQKQPSAGGDAMMTDAPAPAAAAASGSNNKSPPPSTAAALFGSGGFSSTPISLPSFAGGASSRLGEKIRGPRKLVGRSVSASGMGSQDSIDILSPLEEDDDLAVADDEADDEEDELKVSPQPGIGAMEEGTGANRPMQRSNSDCSLSLAQAAAVAKEVIKRQGAKRTDKDPSVLDLLSTFSTLGFTRERLEELHNEHVASKTNGTAAAASSSSIKMD